MLQSRIFKVNQLDLEHVVGPSILTPRPILMVSLWLLIGQRCTQIISTVSISWRLLLHKEYAWSLLTLMCITAVISKWNLFPNLQSLNQKEILIYWTLG